MELEEPGLSAAQQTILWGQLEDQLQKHACGRIATKKGDFSRLIRMEDLVD